MSTILYDKKNDDGRRVAVVVGSGRYKVFVKWRTHSKWQRYLNLHFKETALLAADLLFNLEYH